MARRGRSISTNEIDQPFAVQEIELPATGHIDRTDEMFDDEQIEIIDEAAFKESIEREKFMREELLVEIHESANPNAEQFIQTYVNGVAQFFERGKTMKVKRMFVEALARAKPYTMQTPEYIDSNGNRSTKIVKTSALAYPFAVLSDPSGERGRRWLENILMSA